MFARLDGQGYSYFHISPDDMDKYQDDGTMKRALSQIFPKVDMSAPQKRRPLKTGIAVRGLFRRVLGLGYQDEMSCIPEGHVPTGRRLIPLFAPTWTARCVACLAAQGATG